MSERAGQRLVIVCGGRSRVIADTIAGEASGTSLTTEARFEEMADGNRDGRVTAYEYDRAREFIEAR